MTFDARQIANFFLDLAEEKGTSLTIMVLLKLIYYAHGWYLVERNEPLVRNRFEAWKHGPVIKVVYQEFRQNEHNPIKNRAHIFDPVERTESKAEYDFPANVEEFLRAIFEEYARIHAFTLSDMTHALEGPWDRVWNDSSGVVNPGMIIPNEEIKRHFRQISSGEASH